MMPKSVNRVSEKPSDLSRTSSEKQRCAYCGTEAPLVWVHGHGQCANCGINIAECCQGEMCQTSDRSKYTAPAQ